MAQTTGRLVAKQDLTARCRTVVGLVCLRHEMNGKQYCDELAVSSQVTQ